MDQVESAHIKRMADDHANAQILAQAITDAPGLRLVPERVETNLVWFEADSALGTAKEISDRLTEKGVLISASGKKTLRACMHLDVSKEQCERAAEVIRKEAGG